ncbi:hypothetical protein GIB67_009458 [Kingdonia uniflora]|uniref:CASP-like protein n=1 Tax=Kingdonia uniflora TaxID=39325 RepID=A0A7J7N304_9MAGN|nr:hypothetical protein GIB67_009458 [Kingdonia uniflora]
MEIVTQDKTETKPPQTSHKKFLILQSILRILCFASTLIAIWVMATSKQTKVIYGFAITAKYSYSSALKYFIVAKAIASVLSVVSLVIVLLSITHPEKYFVLFLMDFISTLLTATGFTAASTIGFLGMNGDDHIGWMPICNHFDVFCKRSQNSVIFSGLATILFLILTVWSKRI